MPFPFLTSYVRVTSADSAQLKQVGHFAAAGAVAGAVRPQFRIARPTPPPLNVVSVKCERTVVGSVDPMSVAIFEAQTPIAEAGDERQVEPVFAPQKQLLTLGGAWLSEHSEAGFAPLLVSAQVSASVHAVVAAADAPDTLTLLNGGLSPAPLGSPHSEFVTAMPEPLPAGKFAAELSMQALRTRQL